MFDCRLWQCLQSGLAAVEGWVRCRPPSGVVLANPTSGFDRAHAHARHESIRVRTRSERCPVSAPLPDPPLQGDPIPFEARVGLPAYATGAFRISSHPRKV